MVEENRACLRALVHRIEGAARDGELVPSTIERRQLDMLRSEFSEELAALGDSIPILERAFHVWEGDAWVVAPGRYELRVGRHATDDAGVRELTVR